jgi:Txe/YoeB family toxin of Txe-Axe toxin-antitoxin module
VQKAFDKLDSGNYEEKELKRYIERGFKDIQENPFCGIQIPKRLIPKEYIKKFDIENVWKYNLPNAWRLIYSVARDEIVVSPPVKKV